MWDDLWPVFGITVFLSSTAFSQRNRDVSSGTWCWGSDWFFTGFVPPAHIWKGWNETYFLGRSTGIWDTFCWRVTGLSFKVHFSAPDNVCSRKTAGRPPVAVLRWSSTALGIVLKVATSSPLFPRKERGNCGTWLCSRRNLKDEVSRLGFFSISAVDFGGWVTRRGCSTP